MQSQSNFASLELTSKVTRDHMSDENRKLFSTFIISKCNKNTGQTQGNLRTFI